MEKRRLRRLMLVAGVLMLVAAAFLVECKEKVPKLSPAECNTFCKRLVPCFSQRMANYAKKQEQDIKECIHNCTSQEGRKHGPILRAMKRCGHLKKCGELRACFQKSL